MLSRRDEMQGALHFPLPLGRALLQLRLSAAHTSCDLFRTDTLQQTSNVIILLACIMVHKSTLLPT